MNSIVKTNTQKKPLFIHLLIIMIQFTVHCSMTQRDFFFEARARIEERNVTVFINIRSGIILTIEMDVHTSQEKIINRFRDTELYRDCEQSSSNVKRENSIDIIHLWHIHIVAEHHFHFSFILLFGIIFYLYLNRLSCLLHTELQTKILFMNAIIKKISNLCLNVRVWIHKFHMV